MLERPSGKAESALIQSASRCSTQALNRNKIDFSFSKVRQFRIES